MAEAIKADLIPGGHGFRNGNNPYDRLEEEYGRGGPRDGVLTQLTRDQGWGLPAQGSVDQAVAGGGVELFRGVRPFGDVSAEQQLNDMRDNPDFAYGSGIYGNGIYFSVDKRVADAFAHRDPDSAKSATDAGKTVRVALSPDAKIVGLKKLEAEHKKWFQENHANLPTGMSDMLFDMGRFAAMRGYDAIKVEGMQDGYRDHTGGRKGKISKATQYVVLNRGALTMEGP